MLMILFGGRYFILCCHRSVFPRLGSSRDKSQEILGFVTISIVWQLYRKKSNNEYFKALILQVPSYKPKHLDYKENKSKIFNKQIRTYKNSSKPKHIW